MIALILNATLRTIVLAGIVALVLRLFRVRNPHILLSVWTGVLVASLMMPLALNWSPVTIPVTVYVPPRQNAGAAPTVSQAPSATTENAAPIVSTAVSNTTIPFVNWVRVAAIAYAIIAVLLVMRLIFGLTRTAVINYRARRINANWTDGADIRISDAITVPVSFSTTILVPSDYSSWSTAELQAVLAHEKSHIARGDFFVQLLARLNSCIFWHNPLSWWLMKRLIELGEAASDTAAIVSVADRSGYANLLLSMSSRAQRTVVSVAMARPTTVARRVERILSGEPLFARSLLRHHAAVVGIITVMVFVCAGRISPTLAQSGPSVAVATKVLDKYVGYYRVESNASPHMVLTVAREGQHLYAQFTGFPIRSELVAESATTFDLPSGQKLTFEVGANGHVTRVHSQEQEYEMYAVPVAASAVQVAEDEISKGRAEQARPRNIVAIDPSILDNYVGFYSFRARRAFTVTREGDHLFVQMTGQPKMGFVPEGPKDFFLPGFPLQITFVTDESGKATELVQHTGGLNFPAPRVDQTAVQTADAAVAANIAEQRKPRTAIAVDPTTLDRYIGRYQLSPSAIITVTRDGDHLFTQMPNAQAKIEIFPETDHKFFFTVMPAQLTFITSGSGPAGQVIFHQNGNDMPFGRID